MNKIATEFLKEIAKKKEGTSYKNIESILKGEKELKINKKVKTVIPAPIRSGNITFADLQQEIRDLAYCKWENAGYPISDGCEFWQEAEKELFGPDGLQNGGYYVYIESEDSVEYKLIQS
jgi:hypothetical protein